MKANKCLTIIPLLVLSSVLSGRLSAQENLMTGELLIKNSSANETIYAEIHPASMVFNGKENEYTPHMRYDLRAVNLSEDPPIQYGYINGRNDSISGFWVAPGTEIMINHDNDYTVNGTVASVGYGRYLIRISLFRSDTVFWFDTCTVEWDAAYPYNLPPPNNYWRQDLILEYHANSNDRWITFIWQGGTRPYNIDYVGKNIVCWDQQYAQTGIGGVDSARRLRQKYLGTFVYDTAYSCPYTSFPQDSRADCGTENQKFNDPRSGHLTLHLTVDKDVHTRDTLLDYPTSIVIGKHAAMKIAAGRTFDMITPSNTGDSAYTDLVVGDSAFLILYGGSRLIVQAPNRLTLTSGSSLTLALNSAIVFKPGSTFCNKGGRINGFSNGMIFEKGLHGFPCALESPIVIDDSCKFVLNDSAVISLPDNFTLHLSGNETSLILNPGSKLLFGENSGIVCDSGARLIANNATFASVDSAKKWNGISLNDPSHDTIRNCTIKNAMYGIALSGKYDPDESPEPYSTEISGCSFLNTTSYVLNNGIYLEGSAHVLLKDNTVSATNLSIGFTHGIYAEYCPGEMLIFVSNNISNCNNGMTIIQSSPYIAFNMLSGNSYGESGLFLDNSNGTIKYNVISDFYYSYYSFYSSPDLLKNTFDNSCDDNVYLSSSSVPVMHPLVSGGSTYWFAGDNHITGSPYDAGILFDEDAYPDLNYGYNRFTLSGSSYYISGINPPEGSREFYAVQNYWQDVPPDNSGAGTYVLALGRQHNASGRKS